MKRFFVLLKKETKELLTPQVILPLVLTVLVFYGLGKMLTNRAQQVQKPTLIAVQNENPTSSYGKDMITAVEKGNFSVLLLSQNQDVSPQSLRKKNPNIKALVVIPADFGNRLNAHQPASVRIMTLQNHISISSAVSASAIGNLENILSTAASHEAIHTIATSLNPAAIRNPILFKQQVAVGNKVANVSIEQISSYIASQTIYIPIILFFVIIMAAQMIATAVATEKENKTLETLLATPISRKALVGAKMLSAAIVAGIAASLYMVGFRSYTSGYTASQNVSPIVKAAVTKLGLTLSPESYILLALALFMGILCALAIALIIGAFAENIKSTQSLISPLMIFLLIPYLTTLLFTPSTMPTGLKIFNYIDPFSYPFAAAPHLYAHQYIPVLLGLLYQFIFFLICLFIAAKIFSSDKILTLKLRIGRRR